MFNFYTRYEQNPWKLLYVKTYIYVTFGAGYIEKEEALVHMFIVYIDSTSFSTKNSVLGVIMLGLETIPT